MKLTKKFKVTSNLTAEKMGSGDLAVLATPALIAFAENTCQELLGKQLKDKETSVGTQIECTHLLPSKVGTEIELIVAMEMIHKKKYTFSFQAFQLENKVGEGTHERVIVKRDSFLKNLK